MAAVSWGLGRGSSSSSSSSSSSKRSVKVVDLVATGAVIQPEQLAQWVPTGGIGDWVEVLDIRNHE